MGWEAMHLWRFGPWHFREVAGEFDQAVKLCDAGRSGALDR